MSTPIDKLQDTPKNIIAAIRHQYLEIEGVLARVQSRVPYIKRQISEYQGAALYALAAQYNQPGTKILEIGTAWGYSAACMASAASEAKLITLNPKPTEFPVAVQNLSYWPNVQVLNLKSWDYVSLNQDKFDLIFIDGDHGQVERDLVWWDVLNPGGLFLFHDYAADGSWRPCQHVYNEVNRFGEKLGRPLDVLIEDNRGVGLAGWYK